MGKKKAIRVNVGGNRDSSTDVWRIWAQGDDVYFWSRSVSHNLHVSLHKSGVWKLDIDGHRYRLNQEFEVLPGWGVGPRLVFPNLRVNRLGFEGRQLRDSGIIILPHAPVDNARVIQTFFRRRDKSADFWQICQQYLPSIPDWQGKLKLRSRGEFFLASYIVALTDTELAQCYDHKQKTKINFKNSVPEIGVAANLVVIDSPRDQLHPTILLSIPLDKDNCAIDENEESP